MTTFAQDLVEIRNILANNLEEKGVQINESDGIRTLAKKIGNIPSHNKIPTIATFQLIPESEPSSKWYINSSGVRKRTYAISTSYTDIAGNIASGIITRTDPTPQNATITNDTLTVTIPSDTSETLNFKYECEGDEYYEDASANTSLTVNEAIFSDTCNTNEYLQYYTDNIISNSDTIPSITYSSGNYLFDGRSQTSNQVTYIPLTSEIESSNEVQIQMRLKITLTSGSSIVGFAFYNTVTNRIESLGGLGIASYKTKIATQNSGFATGYTDFNWATDTYYYLAYYKNNLYVSTSSNFSNSTNHSLTIPSDNYKVALYLKGKISFNLYYMFVDKI